MICREDNRSRVRSRGGRHIMGDMCALQGLMSMDLSASTHSRGFGRTPKPEANMHTADPKACRRVVLLGTA